MTKTARYRIVLPAVLLICAFGLAGTKSPAALDMFVGARKVVTNQPLSACNNSAKMALGSVMQSVQEIGTGDTGEWVGYGAPDPANGSTAAAAIHCYPLDSGYLVTFTCAAQVPPNADSGSALCAKLEAAFDAKPAAFAMPALATGRR